ncbi:sodium-dependent glucose transporter 1 [Brienomyrus brachyistius]|uniref:sodium-dependent glucose transporter 1 n=1 Tax=Brienomyrus brachyistius TaxID=42636 RepID=UPI0020B17BC7|nr:sodium-dependent glucose transporter 1 [Brienomyrus brachyistius]
MSASATGEPAAKKKQVRFARVGEDEDNEDQDEDTLFDKRKDARGGLKGVMKRVRRLDGAGAHRVAVLGPDGSAHGTCSQWMVTVALCASFLGLGMSISVLGPTFGDLATNVRQSISNISYIFVGRSAGYMGGSVVAGFLFDIMNHHLLLGLSMLLTAVGMIGVPFCKSAILLTLLISCVGVSMGFLDTGGNVLILKTWGDRAGPYMQALHFSFAVGAFISPIISKLLFGSTDHLENSKVFGSTTESSPSTTEGSVPPLKDPTSKLIKSTLHLAHAPISKSMWAYIVIGVFLLLVSLLFFVLYSRSSPAQDMAKISPGKPRMAKYHNALILLLFFFFFWYVGAEVAYGSFIFTYAKDVTHMAQSRAAGLNSLFWGTFAATRGLAIFLAACMKPGTMILLSLVGCTLSSLLMVLFSRNRMVLWSCTALYGASMATTFPSGISWLEQYTTVTGRSAAVFVVGAALGEMVLPAVVGLLLGIVQELPVLMYLSLGTATITSILFPVMYKLATSPGGTTWRPRDKPGADDSEHYQALLDTGANEEEEEEEDEADQWNDTDFEVIQMDDASLSSPDRTTSSAAAMDAAEAPEDSPVTPTTTDLTPEPADPLELTNSPVTLLGDSPRG